MSSGSDHNKCVDLLRIPEAEQRSILDELEEASSGLTWVEARRSKRYRYTVREGLVLRLDGSKHTFRVRPRNLSTGGLSVLHGSFVYPGTACDIVLRTLTGGHVLVSGRVARCRCVHGRIHEVSIRFDDPIAVESFVETGPGTRRKGKQTAGDPVTYHRDSVIRLAQHLEQLATSDAPREELARALAQLVRILRGNGQLP